MKKIQSALISVYHKTGLEDIIRILGENDVKIYSTGGTQKYIEDQGVTVHTVEGLTTYPSILGGRVKTLHPKVFGGILAKREDDHLAELAEYQIPEIDLVIVDLYPFEETVRNSTDESEIIEKIDIGGISLIRAAAKNYKDILVVASQNEYPDFNDLLLQQGVQTTADQRKIFARKAFMISSHYDTSIFNYFNQDIQGHEGLRLSLDHHQTLRYGENPHQKGIFFGNLEDKFDKLNGKELSYNNLVDVDAAVELMHDFQDNPTTFAVLKHTNACGLATRDTTLDAWHAALAGDPVSAFGGILITNGKLDLATAKEINTLFYEVLIAPDFEDAALDLLKKKKNRILLKIKSWDIQATKVKTILNGVIHQDTDATAEQMDNLECVTTQKPTSDQLKELTFAIKCAKHLKSNTIVFSKDQQLLGMGCGQTSRVDACKQAIDKAVRMGFDLKGSVMASDAFFPFPDCVELAHQAGIEAIVQPGGSIKDKLSIEYCDAHKLPMVFTGIRHFKH